MISHRKEKSSLEAETLLNNELVTHQGKSWDAKLAAIVALTVLNILMLVLVFVLQLHPQGIIVPQIEPIAKSAIVAKLPSKEVQFHWKTVYSSDNETQAAEAWDAIDSAHGHIAVDHRWAAENNWLPSMPVPGDEGKGLYLLESYHQLHCLKIVRKLLHEASSGLPLSYPIQHGRHCLDYFRQFVICHADNTPLYTKGEHTAGDGQIHMCKDWNALRDYATNNSACFKDRVAFEPLRDQFGHCDGGIDGVALDY